MPWWHEDYLDKLDLYFHFTALAKFTQDLPLGTARWGPLSTTAPQFVDRGRVPETRDVVLLPRNRWGKAEHDEFLVQRDGTIADGRVPRQLLHGGGHPDLENPPTFVVDYPRPGKFSVQVRKECGRQGRSALAEDAQSEVGRGSQDQACCRGLAE